MRQSTPAASPSRWRYAQSAERAYQQKKSARLGSDAAALGAIAERKSRYVAELLAALHRPLGPDATTVEIGSGSHGMIWRLACARRIAIDPLAGFYFERFRILQDNGTLVSVAKGEAVPLASGVADCVLCENVLDHTHAPEAVLAEVHRLLKSNGIVYLSVDVHSLFWRVLSKAYNTAFALGVRMNVPAFPAHPHHLSAPAVHRMLAAAGLDVLWQRPATAQSPGGRRERIKHRLGKDRLLECVLVKRTVD